MSRVWDADIEIGDTIACVVIAEQFPDLCPFSVHPFGSGWDNTAFLVKNELVFRFPRRKIAVPWLENEARLLPRIAARLPAPVPVPEYIGAPSDHYPYTFSGYRCLPGKTACFYPLTEEDRAKSAAPLARFLRALHSTPLETVADAPGDMLGRADLRKRLPPLVERLRNPMMAQAAPGIDTESLIATAERLAKETPPWDGMPSLVHGDLYARHLLLDEGHIFCGVIDWGDIHLGDPAIDHSIAFSFLPPGPARNIYWENYGNVDIATRNRACFRAIHYGAILSLYGAEIGDNAIKKAGLDALCLSASCSVS